MLLIKEELDKISDKIKILENKTETANKEIVKKNNAAQVKRSYEPRKFSQNIENPQKELIKEGKNEFIIKTSIDKKGKFGRLLGELLPLHDRFVCLDVANSGREFGLPSELIKAVDNRSYNQILVDEGHATEYFGGKK